ncbi:MAG TPA: hypothetical protein VHE30_23120 [Polyangiaceae bacterium]|nr:hypothetical protein [Polyangiaceae bacterium]
MPTDLSESAGASASAPRAGISPGKRLALELSVGALLGFSGWSFAGPTVISWWYEPPSKDAFSCAGSVRMALGEFVKMQLGSALVGALGLALVLFVIRRAFRPKSGPTTSA